MSEYSGSSPFDQTVEKATPDTPGDPNWASIIEISDKAGQSTTGPKDCLTSVMKRLAHSSKNVQLHAVTLLNSCVLNCGAAFHKEIASPEFVKEARLFLAKASADTADKFKENLQKWAESEFKEDSKLSVIPTFYQALRGEGAYFGMGSKSAGTSQLSAKAPSTTSTSSGADADLEAAIALSLKESKTKSSSLYPQMSALGAQSTYTSAPAPTPSNNYAAAPAAGRQVRALYDFEAVEENELTFKTGDLITVLDDSDPNWWKGTTWRGEGLFPVNFVTIDLSLDGSTEGSGTSDRKSVQFNEEVQVEQFDPDSVQIDESVIDQALDQIQNADPTGLTDDSPEMLHLEEECKVMGPLIDQELEQIDTKHNELMNLNQKLTDAFQLYTELMKEASNVPQYASTAPVGYAQQQLSATMPTGYLSSQQQPLPAGVGAAGIYSSYNPHTEPTSQTQTFYIPGAYGGQPQPVINQPTTQEQPPQQPPPPPFNQTAMLQQYQMGGAGMSSLQYMPSTGETNMDGMPLGYNASQTNYHQQVQPHQQLS